MVLVPKVWLAHPGTCGVQIEKVIWSSTFWGSKREKGPDLENSNRLNTALFPTKVEMQF